MRPARSDRRFGAPHQSRKECTARATPGAWTKPELNRVKASNDPRVAPRMVRNLDWRDVGLKLVLTDFLDAGFTVR
jgi:hypothetical protein